MIAALFVETNGVYFGLPNVDPWDKSRDARLYAGPHPVVAHPPCERWGRYWSGGPSAQVRRSLGDDDGCFESALKSVRVYGGVIEHPEASHAWAKFGLFSPPRGGGWIVADEFGGWTCCIEQGHYGHPARKATWLYARGSVPPSLKWGRSSSVRRLDLGFHSKEERAFFYNPPKNMTQEQRDRRRALIAKREEVTGKALRDTEHLSRKERLGTPLAFRDLLISIAEKAKGK